VEAWESVQKLLEFLFRFGIGIGIQSVFSENVVDEVGEYHMIVEGGVEAESPRTTGLLEACSSCAPEPQKRNNALFSTGASRSRPAPALPPIQHGSSLAHL